MLSCSSGSWCFARIALDASSRFLGAQQRAHVAVARGHEEIQESGTESSPPQLWIDDTVAIAKAQAAHRRSPEYKELHRAALTNAAMGLFGGEPGFEKAHRVWVDPDRPHMRHIYNSTALAKNLRYARYGYYKRDMNLLDVDKLVRHARLLPTPNRLLTDFLYQRVPLPDKSCAAFIRYQRSQIQMLSEWERSASFACAEEMFERLLVTSIPPVAVGVETHAEMVRCAAVCKDWVKGYHVYWQRAREEEERCAVEGGGVENFRLDSNAYDAVIELCLECERVDEGVAAFCELINRNLRPRTSTLNKMMLIIAAGAKKLHQAAPTDDPEATEAAWNAQEQRGFDVWALFDFFQLSRTTESLEAYMRMGAVLRKPMAVVEAVSFADKHGIPLSLPCFHWLLYAVRGIPDLGNFVIDVVAQLSPRGLSADYIAYTMAFLYCAHQRDGDLVLSVYEQFVLPSNGNLTPEMVLLMLQAFARCEAPTPAMIAAADSAMERLERTGSSVDHFTLLCDEYLDLCSVLGAVATAFGRLRTLVARGESVSSRALNAILLCNANAVAPNGSSRITEEVVQLFELIGTQPTAHTVECLAFSVEAHGATDAVAAFAERIEAMQRTLQEAGRMLPADVEIPICDDDPGALRSLRTEWKLNPRDMVLKRYGQRTRLPGKESTNVGSMLGSTIPFGRNPGEKMV